MKFKCPVCMGEVLEEVTTKATVVFEVTDVDENNIEYGEQNLEGGPGKVNVFYQCYNCGEIIKKSGQTRVKNKKELFDWLNSRGMI